MLILNKWRSDWLSFEFILHFGATHSKIKWGLIGGLLIILIRLVLWII